MVLFDNDYSVRRAVLIPAELTKAAARYVPHVNGDRVVATDEFLGQPGTIDITEQLRALARRL